MRPRASITAALLFGVALTASHAAEVDTDPAAPAAERPAASEDAGAAEQEQPVPATGSKPARGTRLQGMAYLGRHRDVVGATVKVVDESDPSVLYWTATDEKGRFRVGELANGSYRVEVRREGLEPVVKNGVELRFPFRAIVELPMQTIDGFTPASDADDEGAAPVEAGRVTLRGAAHDLDGGRLADVTIRLVKADGSEDPREAVTGPDGSFSIDDLSPGRWRLDGRGVGFLPIRGSLVVGQTADLQLWLVSQPAGYDPSPLDLMPAEIPIPPAGLGGRLLSR